MTLPYGSAFSSGNRSNNTTVGFQSGYDLTTGSYNIALGSNVDLPSNTGSRQLDIGNVLYATNLYNGGSPSSAPATNATFGIGTTSPYAHFSIQANGSDTNNILFAIGSSTVNSTTTLLTIDNQGNLSSSGSLAISGSATSTFSNGINLAGGCVAINGTCLAAGGGGGAVSSVSNSDGTLTISPTTGGVVSGLNLSHGNNWAALQQFLNASTTLFSAFGPSYFGATATSSFTSAGRLGILNTSPAYALDVSGFINTDQFSGYKQAGNTILYASSTNSTVLVGTTGGTSISSSTVLYNTSIGSQALNSNTSGSNNAALGALAMFSNTSGSNNSAFGLQSLEFSTSGSSNVAIGSAALINNANSSQNTVLGNQAAQGLGGSYSNTGNVVVGHQAGRNFATGSNYNTLVGYQSGYNLTTGTDNILIGAAFTRTNANLTTGSNNVGIGYDISFASATANNQLNIGNYIYGTGLSGTGSSVSNASVGFGTSTPYSRLTVWGSDTASSTLAFTVVNNASTTLFAVFDGGNAQLSGSLTQSSDRRLKTNITSLDASSSLSLINSLTPVAYDWLDPEKGGVRQYGFIAQQVQQVFPNLVSTTSATALTPDGTLGLNYLGLIAPLVEAVQTLSRDLASLETTVAGFANSFTTKQLCIADDSGKTCISRSQLQALLTGQPSVQISAPTPIVISGTSTPPSINIQGSNPATINVGDTYTDLGAIVHDNQGHDLSYRIFINGALSGNILIDTSHVATDTIDYVATDIWGNTTTSTRTVIIASTTSQ